MINDIASDVYRCNVITCDYFASVRCKARDTFPHTRSVHTGVGVNTPEREHTQT